MQTRPADVDNKILHQIRSLSPSDVQEVMKKLDQAARTSHIRNLSAYIGGVIRRTTKVPTEAHSTTADSLIPEARNILENLYSRGLVQRGELDGKPLHFLASKSAEIQVLVMDTFSDRKLKGVRNMAGQLTIYSGAPLHCSTVPNLRCIHLDLTLFVCPYCCSLLHFAPKSS